jgi:hypothetical protein
VPIFLSVVPQVGDHRRLPRIKASVGLICCRCHFLVNGHLSSFPRVNSVSSMQQQSEVSNLLGGRWWENSLDGPSVRSRLG